MLSQHVFLPSWHLLSYSQSSCWDTQSPMEIAQPPTPNPSPSLFVWIHAPQLFSPLWDTVSFHFPSHSLICLHFPTYGAGLRAPALLRDPGAAGVTCRNATMTSAQPGKSPYPPSLSILFAMRHCVPWWKSHPPSK